MRNRLTDEGCLYFSGHVSHSKHSLAQKKQGLANECGAKNNGQPLTLWNLATKIKSGFKPNKLSRYLYATKRRLG